MPPWLLEMNRRMGLHEGRDNRALSAWLRIGRFLGDPAKLPWCGDAVETAIVKTLPDEPVPSNPFWAQAWKAFGIDAGGPIVGSIGVIRWSAKAGHVGIVYNFHHGHEHIRDFPSQFDTMEPYLLCVNINGMAAAERVRSGRDKILTIGSGRHEEAMLRVVLASGYSGPVGVLDHRSDRDSEEVLRENLAGLVALRTRLSAPQ